MECPAKIEGKGLKQSVVLTIKAHVTDDARSKMNNRNKFNTEANEKADELAKRGANLYHGQQAEWIPGCYRSEIDRFRSALKYVAQFHSHL